MNVTRTARNTSAAVVAGIAGYASYWHQVAVATSAGERAEIAHVIPLSVDGMLVVASIVMVDDRQQGRKPRWSARIAFLIGTLATIGANVAGAHPTPLGRTVAAWPALALLLVVEMLSRKGKQIPGEIPTAAPTPQSSPVTPSAVVTAAEAFTATALPAPVSPAPAGPRSPERIPGTGPVARREARSPLTGKVLTDRVPRV
jgi:Protein of unknown function (DUF2637)